MVFLMESHINGDALFCYILLHCIQYFQQRVLDSAVKVKTHAHRRYKAPCVENATLAVRTVVTDSL